MSISYNFAMAVDGSIMSLHTLKCKMILALHVGVSLFKVVHYCSVQDISRLGHIHSLCSITDQPRLNSIAYSMIYLKRRSIDIVDRLVHRRVAIIPRANRLIGWERLSELNAAESWPASWLILLQFPHSSRPFDRLSNDREGTTGLRSKHVQPKSDASPLLACLV